MITRKIIKTHTQAQHNKAFSDSLIKCKVEIWLCTGNKIY